MSDTATKLETHRTSEGGCAQAQAHHLADMHGCEPFPANDPPALVRVWAMSGLRVWHRIFGTGRTTTYEMRP